MPIGISIIYREKYIVIFYPENLIIEKPIEGLAKNKLFRTKKGDSIEK